jgi:hypothetical protein
MKRMFLILLATATLQFAVIIRQSILLWESHEREEAWQRYGELILRIYTDPNP